MILDTSGTTLKLTMRTFLDMYLGYVGDTNNTFHLCGGEGSNSCSHDSRHVCSCVSYKQLSIFFKLVQMFPVPLFKNYKHIWWYNIRDKYTYIIMKALIFKDIPLNNILIISS